MSSRDGCELRLSSRTPEIGADAKAAAIATKNPVCKHRSLSTLPGACAACQCQGPMNQGPQRTHHMPQATAKSFRPLPLQARPAFHLWLPYPSLSPAWVSKKALISLCFNPLLSGRGTDAWGQPKDRGGARTKDEHQELCEQRREREIVLCSLRSSGLNPHNWPDKPCVCRIPE